MRILAATTLAAAALAGCDGGDEHEPAKALSHLRVRAPAPAPREVADLRRLSIRPREWESCLRWFAVDVYVTGDGEIAAVTLDYFEP